MPSLISIVSEEGCSMTHWVQQDIEVLHVVSDSDGVDKFKGVKLKSEAMQRNTKHVNSMI